MPVKNVLHNRLANQNGAGNMVTNGVGNYVVANNNVIKNKTAKSTVMGLHVYSQKEQCTEKSAKQEQNTERSEKLKTNVCFRVTGKKDGIQAWSTK